jgi:hypothetical protein
MQEEKNNGTSNVPADNLESLFLDSQETYQEAQVRTAEENKGFAKTEFFKLDKLGTYRLRVLPAIPSSDGSTGRKSYEHPVHQMLLEIEKPSEGGKAQYVYVNAVRATDAGFPLDIIDTYRKVAVAAAKETGDEKLAEKIAGGNYGGGLKFSYAHCAYIFDLNERAKGVQLLTLSHSQYKELDDRKFKLWQKKLAKNPKYPCPVSSVKDAYPVEIEKKKNGQKTEYTISIDNESDTDELSIEELTTLMNMPRLPEVILRYTRYQFGATIEFLKQFDTKYGLQVMETDEMKEAIATLEAELPKTDTSSFSFDKRNKDAKENAESGALSLDMLLDKFDRLQEQSLGDKTEQGQELRAMIRTFIEQEKLGVRVTRTTTNAALLEMIEKEMQGPGEEPEPAEARAEETPAGEPDAAGEQATEEPAPRRRR